MFDKNVKNKKPTKKPYKSLDGWSRDSLEYGSDAWVREIVALNDAMTSGENDMIQFIDNMNEWVNPDSVEGKARMFNDQYCSYMLNRCLVPIQRGLDAESVVTTIGMGLGMALFSKDFRSKVSGEVSAALLPVMKDRALHKTERKDQVRDAMIRTRDKLNQTAAMPGAGKAKKILASKFSSVVDHLPSPGCSYSELMEKRMDDYIVKQRSRQLGHPYLTPEAAATKYLSFCNQAYTALRTDSEDMHQLRDQIKSATEIGEHEKADRLQKKLDHLSESRDEIVMQRFNTASGLLKKTAAVSGVSSDVLQEAVMKAYGKLSDHNPKFQLMFDQTAISQLTKVQEVDAHGRTCWRGKYVDEKGMQFTDMLTPRRPMSRKKCMKILSDQYQEFFDNFDSIDDIQASFKENRYRKVEDYFRGLVADDLAMEKPFTETPQSFADQILNEARDKACTHWVWERSEPMRAQQAAADKSQSKSSRDQQMAEEHEARMATERARQEQIRQQQIRDEARDKRAEASERRSAEAHNARLETERAKQKLYRDLAAQMKQNGDISSILDQMKQADANDSKSGPEFD